MRIRINDNKGEAWMGEHEITEEEEEEEWKDK